MSAEEQAKKWQEIIQKAWTDEAFKQKLLANANEALEEEGIEVPAGIEVRVVEDTPEVRHVVLPPPSLDEGALDDDQLDAVSGGANSGRTHSDGYICIVT